MMQTNTRFSKLFLNLKLAFAIVLFAFCSNLNTHGQIAVTVVGNTYTTPNLATSYPSLASAISALNAITAISGNVIFNLAAGGTETFGGTASGTITTSYPISSATVTFQRSGSGANPLVTAGVGTSTSDAIIKIAGSDYITIDGLDLQENAANNTTTKQMEYGYYITNLTATNGSLVNTIKNCKITLNRTNTSTKAIYQKSVTPSSTAGTNSFNKFQNIIIENSYQGIYLDGYSNNNFYDRGNEISNCTIGAATANDIGNGVITFSGIYVSNNGGISIFNNVIRNLNMTGTTPLYGINVENFFNTSLSNNIYNNKVYNLSTTNIITSALLYAISAEVNSGITANVYNNVIWGLQHAIASPSAAIVIRAIAAANTTTSTGTVNFYNNSVRIDEDQYPTSACLYLGQYGIFNIKNNILANFSTPGATSIRYCIVFPSSPPLFNADYNDYYIAAGTNNFIGMYGSSNNKTTLTEWQSATYQESNSLNTFPNFTSTTDLTPTSGNFIPGVAISTVTTDFNGVSRKDPTALGAYEGSIAGRWLGTSSTDWNAAANWDGNTVPDAASDLYIGAMPANQPHITNTAASPAECNNITIYPGAILTVDAGKALTVSGNIINKSDSTALVLKSDASGTASLIQGNTTVRATAERYIANNNNWHFLCSPVYNQYIKPQFAPLTADNTFDFYKWDETNLLDPGFPWLNIRNSLTTYNSSGFDNFENGRGYLVAYSGAYGGSSIHNFSGNLNRGNITIPITAGGNTYNLIGNPYPSAIDWDNTALIVETNYTLGINPPYWIWNESTGNYASYNSLSGGTNNATNIIAPHQGFFVHAVNQGSILMSDAARVHPGSQNFLKSAVSMLLRLKVTSTANNYSDEVIVNFNNNAGPDAGAAKWFSLLADSPSLYTVKNSGNFSINILPALTAVQIVPLSFKAGVNGFYSIKASALNSFTTPTYIYLKDLKTNHIQELMQNDTYSFSGSTTDVAERFELIFSLSPLEITDASVNKCNIYTFDNILYINTVENIREIAVYNLPGQLIKTINNPGKSASFNFNALAPAYYIIRATGDDKVHTARILIK